MTVFVDPKSLGHDLKCLDDLDPDMLEVDEIDVLTQDILHRWQTPRGWLLDDLEYGRALVLEMSRAMDDAELAALPAPYVAEALKDECVFSCSARTLSIARTTDGDTLSVEFAIESALGPFRLTVDISQAGVLVREVST